jgi:hypothetical protein
MTTMQVDASVATDSDGPEGDRPVTGERPSPATRPTADGPVASWSLAPLALWIALVVGLEGLLWLSGEKARALAEAVERGAARVEARTSGEVSEDQVRAALRKQRATLRFWSTLALIGDFVVEPLSLAVRATAVATLLSALAALVGRPARFSEALGACVAIQGVWVLGLAVRVALTFALGGAEADTSLALALPRGTHSALAWLAARQVDAFALWGWAAMARGGWRRGQVNLAVAFLVCAVVALGEAIPRVGFALIVGAGIRLTFLPSLGR